MNRSNVSKSGGMGPKKVSVLTLSGMLSYGYGPMAVPHEYAHQLFSYFYDEECIEFLEEHNLFYENGCVETALGNRINNLSNSVRSGSPQKIGKSLVDLIIPSIFTEDKGGCYHYPKIIYPSSFESEQQRIDYYKSCNEFYEYQSTLKWERFLSFLGGPLVDVIWTSAFTYYGAKKLAKGEKKGGVMLGLGVAGMVDRTAASFMPIISPNYVNDFSMMSQLSNIPVPAFFITQLSLYSLVGALSYRKAKRISAHNKLVEACDFMDNEQLYETIISCDCLKNFDKKKNKGKYLMKKAPKIYKKLKDKIELARKNYYEPITKYFSNLTKSDSVEVNQLREFYLDHPHKFADEMAEWINYEDEYTRYRLLPLNELPGKGLELLNYTSKILGKSQGETYEFANNLVSCEFKWSELMESVSESRENVYKRFGIKPPKLVPQLI